MHILMIILINCYRNFVFYHWDLVQIKSNIAEHVDKYNWYQRLYCAEFLF